LKPAARLQDRITLEALAGEEQMSDVDPDCLQIAALSAPDPLHLRQVVRYNYGETCRNSGARKPNRVVLLRLVLAESRRSVPWSCSSIVVKTAANVGRRQNKPRLPVRNYTPDAYGPNSDIRPYR
jgi:hypothetical protein